MNITPCHRLLLAGVVACVTLPTAAADRVRAGEWETTLNIAGRSITKSICLTQADADLINGDATSIRAYADKVGAPVGCKATDVKINGNQVTVTSMCTRGENVGTTTYFGDHYEASNTNGAKSQSKRVGACK